MIRIVVPFGTGAVQDTVARAFNNELGAALNASVIVENRAGAGGTVGAAIVAKAPADGNTLVLAAASHHIAGHLYSKLPYDPLKDFVGVADIGNAGYVVVASSDMKVSNTAEFIREVKAQSGQVQLRLGRQRQRHAPGDGLLPGQGRPADDAHPDEVHRRGGERSCSPAACRP